MYSNNQTRLRLIVIVAILGFVILIAWYSLNQLARQGKIPVTIETSPENTTIKIDNKPAHTGTNYIVSGVHTFSAEKEGYKTASQTISVDTVNNYVALLPSPVSDDAIKEAASDIESARAQTISGVASSTSGKALRSDNPIIKKLPYSDISGPYKIDFGYNQDDNTKLYLIVSFSTPDGRQKAIEWLKENGVDTTTREIIFDGFNNPATRGVAHD